MRILMLAPDFKPNPGGLAEYVHQMARNLTLCGDEVVVRSSVDGHGDDGFKYTVRRGSLGPWCATSASRWNVVDRGRMVAANCRKAGNILDRVNPDVLWFTTVAQRYSMRYWSAACKIRRIPHVVSVHGLDAAWYLEDAFDVVGRMTLRGADRIFFTTRRVGERFLGSLTTEEQLTVVRCGINPEAYRETGSDSSRAETIEDSPSVLCLGRLVSRKGFDTVIQAMPRVRRAVPGARLVVCGDGPDRDRLEGLAESHGLNSAVMFPGYVPEQEKREYLHACDVFAMPSREEEGGNIEGFGIVYLEAAACGKPSIAAETGGVPEAVLHEETGLLVPPDDPDALADAIVKLLKDDELRQRLGRAARRRVEQELNWTSIARRVHGILEEVAQ